MIRILGLTVAVVVPLCLATTTHAQLTPYYVAGAPTPYYGVSGYGGQSYGGFGLEYTQLMPAGGMVMDQYGLWHSVPNVESSAPVAAAQPQPRVRATRSTSRRVAARLAQPRYQLPGGSLGQSRANGGIMYSPAMRYQSYGSGYGWPVGRIDNSGMWWGMPTGY